MYYVYVLKSIKDSKNYTGMTSDLERRLYEHDKGSFGTPSTLNRGPFVLMYAEGVATRKEARARERYFKSGSGRESIKNIPR